HAACGLDTGRCRYLVGLPAVDVGLLHRHRPGPADHRGGADAAGRRDRLRLGAEPLHLGVGRFDEERRAPRIADVRVPGDQRRRAARHLLPYPAPVRGPMNLRRITSFSAAFAAAAVLAVPGAAGALGPSDFDPGRDQPPPPGPAAPPIPMKQNTVCATSAVLPDSQFHTVPASHVFGVDTLHEYGTGVGQTVAVIDSGVTPNARLPLLRGGGDFIMGGDGLEDCDHHGTLIAGIIAAQPALNDGFVGVAPSASILSIRQTS